MSYIDVATTKDEVVCWYRDEETNELKTKREPIGEYCFLYIKDNTGNATHYNIYGDPLRKLSFDDKYQMKQYIDSHDEVFESDVPIGTKYLIENFRDCKADAPVNIMYFDIEVDFDLNEGRGYPRPDNPYGEINAISCYDVSQGMYIMFIPSHCEGIVFLEDERDGIPVETIFCDSESQMLRLFSSYLEEYEIDIITAWNGDGFDIPYMVERACILFGMDKGKSFMCRDGFSAKRRDFINDYGEEVWEWKLVGRHHIDMMKLFKKFQPGEKKSFALDNICREELGENKIDYTGDLGELYRTDPQSFFDYSLHDSRLLKYLDDKKKAISLAMLMSRDSCALPTDIFGSVKVIENGLMKFCRNKGNIVLDDKSVNEKERFEGAIVYDTVPGRHVNVFSIDLASLYPSVMMMLGLSKETMIAQCTRGYEDYIRVMTNSDEEVVVEWTQNKETQNMIASDLLKEIKERGWTISANGTIFTGEDGILSSFVREGFDQRKEYKKLMTQAETEEERQRYDLYQSVRKIRNNSVYGISGEPSFRMYDIRLAESITLTGQIISKWQAQKANELIDRVMGR